MIHFKFSRKINSEFSTILRSRVADHFEETNLGQNANRHMVIKSLTALSLYFVPYFLIVFGGFTSFPILLACFVLMGMGVAFVGISVMHDALHGAYSKDSFLNRIVGFSAVVIGVDPMMWKIQHNVLHHTYPNVEHVDDDIAPRYVMRFTPNQTRRWFHRFQHIYVLLFYTTTTMVWVLFKDYSKLFQYRKRGLVKEAEFRKLLPLVISRKLLYYFFFIVVPFLVLPLPFGQILLMIIAMHLVAGFCLSMVFQPAHVMDTSDFIDPSEEQIEENWDVHQILTTINFGMKNKVLTWFVGGLNFQIEHHLFPNVCHVHYPGISKIVQKTAAEFDIPYQAEVNFRSAILNHFRMLRALGREDHVETVKRAAISNL